MLTDKIKKKPARTSGVVLDCEPDTHCSRVRRKSNTIFFFLSRRKYSTARAFRGYVRVSRITRSENPVRHYMQSETLGVVLRDFLFNITKCNTRARTHRDDIRRIH